MTRERAINSMISHGFTVEQVGEVIKAVTDKPTTKNDLGVDCISRQELLDEINNYRQIERKQLNEIIKNMPSVTPQPRKGHWIVQPSNKEQGERDFIWWKCSECGQVIFSETEKDRKEFHAFCGRCGAEMNEVEE